MLNVLKFWNMLQYALIFGTIWMRMLYVFIIFLFFSLIPIKIYHHLHVQPLIFCFSISTLPYFFLLPSSLLLYSLPIHESWATTDFFSTISQIPPSLIYKISFTGFFPPFFPFFRSLLTDLWSHMPRDRDRPGSPLITDPLCNEEELQCEGHGGRKWKLPSETVTKAVVLI